MKNIIYTLNEISRKPLLLIAIVVQVIIGTMILIEGLESTVEVIDTVNITKEMFKDKDIYRLQDSSSDNKFKDILTNSEKYEEGLKELYFYLKNSKEFCFYSQQSTNMVIKDFSDEDIFYDYLDNKYSINPTDEIKGKYSVIKSFNIDSDYIKQYDFNISKGRKFVESDFNIQDEVPVLLGAKYDGIYKIGDSFQIFDYYNNKCKKIKVIGILSKNTYSMSGFSIDTLDDRIIYPYENLGDNSSMNDYLNRFVDSYIITEDKDKTLFNIREKSGGLCLFEYTLHSCSGEIENLINYSKNSAYSSIGLSLCILFFTSIAIITVQLNTFQERINEYGVHLLSGASKSDIVIRNIYFTVVYLTIGMISGALCKYELEDPIVSRFDYRIVILLIIVYLILLFLISILPYRKIKNMEVNDIIRGINV